ncbi:MAG: ATP-dependent DNA ligase [Acidimicrobiales bacterium]|nr:ATP-dependent DNA ligase [Acidimicrobiales bacterium]
MASGEAIELDIAGRAVRITSPDKVFFSKAGQTKLDLVEYYLAVAEPFLAATQGRPTLLQRFPDGASGKSFFQKRVPKGAPDWLQTTVVSTPNGTTSNALVVADMAHIAWAVNMGTLGFHIWPYLAATPDITDELRIDLDPTPGTTFEMVRDAAAATKALLDELGIASYIKTTGSKGLHIYVRVLPQWDSSAVRAAAVALARELERRHGDFMTAAWWKEERGRRIFVDFNQNAPHKTVFGAWAVRPRVGAQVSTPFDWAELPDIDPQALTMDIVPARVADHGDPWAAMNDDPQSIQPLLEMSAADMEAGLMDAPWPPVYPKQPNEPPRVAPSRAKKD